MRNPVLVAPFLALAIACSGGTYTTGDAGPADGGPSQLDGSMVASDGGVGTVPTERTSGLYFGACLSTLAAKNISRVLRFYTEATFTPDASGGTLTLTLTPMKVGANQGPPPTVSRDQTIGQPYTVTSSPTNARGVFAASLGTITIPGAANPISGRDLLIEQAAVPGRFATGRFCSQLSGHLVQPTDIQLDGEANTCIYLPVKEGDPTPALQLSDFPDLCALN